MLKKLEEYGQFVEISGFRNVKIEDSKAFLTLVRKRLPQDVDVQFFDADLVATWQHLYFAVANALMAFKTKHSVSKSVAVETAVFASAQRQIAKAIELIGVKSGTVNIAVIILSANADSAHTALDAVAKCIGKEPDEKVLELSTAKAQRIKRVFGISDLELQTIAKKGNVTEALVDAVVERVALLSTQV